MYVELLLWFMIPLEDRSEQGSFVFPALVRNGGSQISPTIGPDWAEKVGRQDATDSRAEWRRRLEEGETGGREEQCHISLSKGFRMLT
jgi:hypothetical protein